MGTFAPQEAEGSCVYCNHCQPCPAGLDVGLINKYYDLALTGDDLAKYHYASLNKRRKTVYNVDTVIPVVRSMLAKWRGWKRSESILENDSAFHSPKGRNLLCVPSLCAAVPAAVSGMIFPARPGILSAIFSIIVSIAR